MTIYAPHHADGANIAKIFPEIFDKCEMIRFQLPNGNSDFFASALYLHAAQVDESLYMVFSAVQRLYGEEHYDAFQYLRKDENRKQLLGLNDDELASKLKELSDSYYDKYGMRKQVVGFYTEFLDKASKQLINSNLYRPANYKAKAAGDTDAELKVRLGLLLHLRDRAGHSAVFIPLSNAAAKDDFMRIEAYDGDKSIEWFSKLTFKDFYEVTRQAMARFWIKKYEDYLANGGSEIIDKLVAEVRKQSDELNKAAKLEAKLSAEG